jgi:hypothetical protein
MAANRSISTLQSRRFGRLNLGKLPLRHGDGGETGRENLSASVCVNHTFRR